MLTKNKANIILAAADEKLNQHKKPLLAICQLLNKEIAHYNWVGFYFMNPNKKQLEIGPYVGAKTNHTKIAFGKGICGQVAESGETFVVANIGAQDNYLACSLETKSEIVVPIYKGEKLVGQIDIDSHEVNPFTDIDTYLLETLCAMIGEKGLSHYSPGN